jgi:hypothetical protein
MIIGDIRLLDKDMYGLHRSARLGMYVISLLKNDKTWKAIESIVAQ